MRIAIIGSGFTGLSAAFYLSEKKHSVTIFEKEKDLGGLASSFKLPGWNWQIEKHYHHWFTNDYAAIELIEKAGLKDKLIFPKSRTSVFYNNHIYPFNSPAQLMNFSPLSFVDRVRTGLVMLYLKLLPSFLAVNLEKYCASDWLNKYFGQKVYSLLWEPLLSGKFGKYYKKVNMAWFWARIKKRTLKLGYLEGGYQLLVATVAAKIKENGGKILTNTPFDTKKAKDFDKIIVTTPSFIFSKMFKGLPEDYKKKLLSIPHLHALNMLLITKEKILPQTYWLNINDNKFPFIAVVAQTNMIDKKYYGGNHITWVGNYLPEGHPYLKMTKEQLFKLYYPYLKKINPSLNLQLTTYNLQLFFGPFAQPVFPIKYSRMKPDFTTPIKNVYLANMDMVYPWDRGTNYAIEMGREVAKLVTV